jgi:hypothetical protein
VVSNRLFDLDHNFTGVTMSALDLTPIVQPILATAGAIISGLLLIYVPKAIAAFEARTGIMLTDQQRATVLGAVQTGAGMIETDLDKGALSVAHININNPAILAQASSVIAAVPVAARALGMSVDGVARMLVGAVDTGSHGVVAPVVVAPAPTTTTVPLVLVPAT